MKVLRRILFSLVPLLLLLALLLVQPEAGRRVAPPQGRAPAGPGPQPGNQEASGGDGVQVGAPVTPGLSPAVRNLPREQPEPLLEREVNPRRLPILELPLERTPGQDPPDPLLQPAALDTGSTPPPLFTFEGLSLFDGGGFIPPDPIGDVGPDHYVQMVNAAFAIFDKSGRRLSGPTAINQLFKNNPATPNCATDNDGDPIVVYDSLADRWLLAQFMSTLSGRVGLCMAVSQTADPAGAYYLYEFLTDQFPDYFKVGVWPDGYYVSTNEPTYGYNYAAYVFEREQMLSGKAAAYQRFGRFTNLLLPADLDGPLPPPAGTPGYFYTFKDGQFPLHGGDDRDRLEIYAFDVDWSSPGNSTFKLIDTITVTPFNYTVCGYFVFQCVPQRDVSQRVDSISEWPMWRLQYRNFGGYETLVGNFTVDVGGDRAGIRWFELRRERERWRLQQEGTHAPPDGQHRWLGSIAMDRQGNIALGYSTSGTSLYPSIRYATRRAADPPGSLQSETTLYAGTGSQMTSTNGDRWGDYSALALDPRDDCTFWYTNEYYSDFSLHWRTRVGTFRLPGCSVTLSSPVVDDVSAGENVSYTLAITNHSNTADTFDLSASGETWPTALSHTVITLAPDETGFFDVHVQVPATAAVGEKSQATVEARSQTDPTRQTTTTVLTFIPYRIYFTWIIK